MKIEVGVVILAVVMVTIFFLGLWVGERPWKQLKQISDRGMTTLHVSFDPKDHTNEELEMIKLVFKVNVPEHKEAD